MGQGRGREHRDLAAVAVALSSCGGEAGPAPPERAPARQGLRVARSSLCSVPEPSPPRWCQGNQPSGKWRNCRPQKSDLVTCDCGSTQACDGKPMEGCRGTGPKSQQGGDCPIRWSFGRKADFNTEPFLPIFLLGQFFSPKLSDPPLAQKYPSPDGSAFEMRVFVSRTAAQVCIRTSRRTLLAALCSKSKCTVV